MTKKAKILLNFASLYMYNRVVLLVNLTKFGQKKHKTRDQNLLLLGVAKAEMRKIDDILQDF